MIPHDQQFSLFELSQIFTIMPRHGRSPKIKFCDREENDLYSIIALYSDNNYLIFYGLYKQENHPIVRQLPWHDLPDKEIVAMCFNPTGYWLLCCTPSGQLILIPVSYFLFGKADYKWKHTEVSIIDLREIEKPSFWKRSQWKLWRTDKQDVPTSVAWWCAKDESQVAIIGHKSGKITFINLLTKVVLHSVSVSSTILKLQIFEPEGHEETSIMVTCSNNKQWQVRLAYKASVYDTYTTILVPDSHVGPKTQPYLINSSQKHQKLFLPKFINVDYILKYDTSQNVIEIQYYGCVSSVSERMRVISGIHDIILTDKLVFVLQRSASQGDRCILLSTIRSYIRERHKDGMPDSILQEFIIPEGEQIIGLFHVPVKGDRVLRGRPAKTHIKKTMVTLYGQGPESPVHMSEMIPDVAHLLDSYVIVTTTSIYVCQSRMCPEQLCIELALNKESPTKLSRLADMLDLETDDIFLKIAEHFLNEDMIEYVLDVLCEAKFNPIQKAALLGRNGYLKHLLAYLKSLAIQRTKEDVKCRPTDFERWVLSNLALKTIIQQYLLESCNINLQRLLRDFLEKDNRFDLIPAIQLLINCGMFDFLLDFCRVKGYLIDMLQHLMDTGFYSMQWQNQITDTLESYNLLQHFQRTNDSGFLACFTARELIHCLFMYPNVLQQYLIIMEQMLPFVCDKTLNDLAKIFSPFNLQIRTLIIVEHQCKIKAAEIKHDEYKAYIGNMSDVVRFYYHILLSIESRKGYYFDQNYISDDGLQFLNSTQDYSPQHLQRIGENQILSCGMFHAAMVCKGEVYTWGADMFGRLGHDDMRSRRTVGKLVFPSQIYSLSFLGIQVFSISCGCSHTLATTNYGIFGWGSSRYGQLGLGYILHECIRPALIEVATVKRLTSINCGLFHTIAVNEQGKVFTWGYGFHGQLGHGNSSNYLEPLEVKSLDNVKAVAAGYFHSLILTNEGTLYSFGLGINGQLGLGSRQQHFLPVKIQLSEEIIQISSGYFHNVVLSKNNEVYSWGITPRILQQICNAATLEKKIAKKERQSLPDSRCLREIPEEYFVPTRVDISIVEGKITQVACGGNHTTLLTNNGELFSWGINMDGQFGIGKRQPQLQEWRVTPIVKRSEFNTQYIYVSCGMDFTIALDKKAKIWGWGRNDFRQLGQIANDNQGAISSSDYGEGRPRSRRIVGTLNNVNSPLSTGGNMASPKKLLSPSPSRLISSSLKTNQPTLNSLLISEQSNVCFNPENNIKYISIAPRQTTSSWVTELISRTSNKRQNVSNPLELHGLTCLMQGVTYSSSFKGDADVFTHILPSQEVFRFLQLNENFFNKNSLQSVINLMGDYLDISDLISLCVTYCDYQMASSLCLKLHLFNQALKWQLKALERHKHEINIFEIAPAIVSFYLRKLQLVEKPPASSLLQEFLNEVTDFWVMSSLPSSELEKVLRDHLNILAPELIHYLQRRESKSSETNCLHICASQAFPSDVSSEQIKCINDEITPLPFKFSTKFCLQVASIILKKMSTKQLAKEDCQKVATFVGQRKNVPEEPSEIPDDKLWQEIIHHLQKDINLYPHIHLSQSFIDVLQRTLHVSHSPWFVKQDHASNSLEDVHLFTCGHHFTKQTFNSLLHKFEDSMKVLSHPLPQVTKILMMYYNQERLVPMACPKCVLGAIKEISG